MNYFLRIFTLFLLIAGMTSQASAVVINQDWTSPESTFGYTGPDFEVETIDFSADFDPLLEEILSATFTWTWGNETDPTTSYATDYVDLYFVNTSNPTETFSVFGESNDAARINASAYDIAGSTNPDGSVNDGVSAPILNTVSLSDAAFLTYLNSATTVTLFASVGSGSMPDIADEYIQLGITSFEVTTRDETPIPGPVPEPSTCILFGMGLAAFFRYKRRI